MYKVLRDSLVECEKCLENNLSVWLRVEAPKLIENREVTEALRIALSRIVESRFWCESVKLEALNLLSKISSAVSGSVSCVVTPAPSDLQNMATASEEASDLSRRVGWFCIIAFVS